MSEDNFDSLLQSLCSVRPFQVFTITLSTGKQLEVDFPNAITFRDGLAVFHGPGGKFLWFGHDKVDRIELSGIETQA